MAHNVRVPPLSQASSARSAPSLALAGIACAMIGLSCTISIFVIVLLTSCAVLLRKLLGGAAERGRRTRSVSPDALCAEPRALGAGQLAEPASPRTAPFHQLARNGHPKEQALRGRTTKFGGGLRFGRRALLAAALAAFTGCLLYTSPSPRD